MRWKIVRWDEIIDTYFIAVFDRVGILAQDNDVYAQGR